MDEPVQYACGQKNHVWVALLGIVAVLVPFILQYDFGLNVFYYYGSIYNDIGLLADTVWRNDFMLSTNELYGKASFFSLHFSPFLLLINALSYFVPADKPEFYSAFVAAMYASFSAALYGALMAVLRPASGWKALWMAALAIAIAFNGIILQGIWMMHFEYLIPVGIFLFLLQYALGNRGWALFFFILTLSVREDAGFHIVAVLGLLTLLDCWRARSLKQAGDKAAFMAVAFCYSLIAWFMTYKIRKMTGAGYSVFEQIYGGSPAYRHLTFGLFARRLKIIILERTSLWMTILAALGCAWRARDPYLLIGLAAYIPWIIFNMAAINNNTGVLAAYYIFPLALLAGWPVIAAAWRHGTRLPAPVARRTVLIQTFFVALGLITFNPYNGSWELAARVFSWPGRFTLMQTAEDRRLVKEFISQVPVRRELGTVMVDHHVLSLLPRNAAQRQSAFLFDMVDHPRKPVDTVIYFYANGRPPEADIAAQIDSNNLRFHYCVPHSRLCVVTNRSRQRLGIFAKELAEKPEIKLSSPTI